MERKIKPIRNLGLNRKLDVVVNSKMEELIKNGYKINFSVNVPKSIYNYFELYKMDENGRVISIYSITVYRKVIDAYEYYFLVRFCKDDESCDEIKVA